MYNINSSRSILGTPFYLFALPIIVAAKIVNRGRIPLVKPIDLEAIQSEWTGNLYCFDCKEDTKHNFIEFRDEPVVESECTWCHVIRTHEDIV